MGIKLFRRPAGLAASLLLLGACARAPSVPPTATLSTHSAIPDAAAAASAEPGFFGWTLAAGDEGVSVIALDAGPAAQAGIRAGDGVRGIAGEMLGADALVARLERVTAGSRLRMAIDRGGDTFDVDVTAGRAADWMGPATLPASPRARLTGAEAPWVTAALDTLPARATPQVERLRAMLARLAQDGAARNTLPRLRAALEAPARGAASASTLLDALAAASTAPLGLPGLLCGELDAACAPGATTTDSLGLDSAAQALAASAVAVDSALAGLGRTRSEALIDLRVLAVETAAGHLIYAQADAPRAIRAMQDSTRIDYAGLLAAWSGLVAVALAPLDGAPAKPSAALPSALAGHVDGTVLGWRDTPAGPLVLGGTGPNRYDLEALAGVIDLGGDDVYRWGEGDPRPAQFIVDTAGDDRYEAGFSGAGAAWLGVAVIVDMAGNDRYRAVFGGCGAGLHGFALLDDRAGNDRYQCDAWSEGAGLYGGGVLLDGGGDDRYLAQTLAQGAGGPRGMGVLVDVTGNDLYRANGLVESSYRTPAVFLGLSQGVGYGLRPHDHGGLGILVDGAGDDRYEGGEFSQGGGYFWGMGVLDDRAGNDLYYGNRYAQGFAAHQAVGLLFERAGDDRYWSMTAAAQGAAWDHSVALFFDGAGDDDHRAGDLSQGAGAQHALAVLYDATGDDVYWASGPRAQGAAGPNGYPLERGAGDGTEAPVASLGVLFDTTGRDRYSTALENGGSRLRTGGDDVQDDVVGFAHDGPGCPGGQHRRPEGDVARAAVVNGCERDGRAP